jgi:hypothetical protein
MVVIVILVAVRAKAVARFSGCTRETAGIEKVIFLKEQIVEEFAVHDFADVCGVQREERHRAEGAQVISRLVTVSYSAIIEDVQDTIE